jgi:trimethylguanosine synthase
MKLWNGRRQSAVLTSTGTEYNATDVFDLSTMQPYNLDKLYKSFSKVSKDMVLYLPRTSDLNQIAKYAPEGNKLEVAHYCMKGASKVSQLLYDF